MVRNSSSLEKSPTKFNVDMKGLVCDSVVMLNQLAELPNFQTVNVRIKVIKEKEAEVVKNGLVKQEYVIADSSGSSLVVTWEENVGILKEDVSYELSGLMVRTFCGRKYLSIPKEKFGVVCIEDIGDVCCSSQEQDLKMMNAIIVGIKYFEVYSGCYSCKGKVRPNSDILGECNRCGATQRLDRCKELASAKLDVEAAGVMKHLSCFSPVLEEICNGDASKALLLSCEPFDLVYIPLF